MNDLANVPAPQLIFWTLGDWRCEYWKTASQRRLIVLFKGEPMIEQPCTDAESVVLKSREFKRLIQTSQERELH